MGFRKVVVIQSAAESIAQISWYIESKGLLSTAEKFSDEVYDFIARIGDDRKGHRLCRDSERREMGYSCIPYKKKYTIVFIELETEIIICEFILSKRIFW